MAYIKSRYRVYRVELNLLDKTATVSRRKLYMEAGKVYYRYSQRVYKLKDPVGRYRTPLLTAGANVFRHNFQYYRLDNLSGSRLVFYNHY